MEGCGPAGAASNWKKAHARGGRVPDHGQRHAHPPARRTACPAQGAGARRLLAPRTRSGESAHRRSLLAARRRWRSHRSLLHALKTKNSPPHDLAAVVHGDAHACDERQRGARRRVRRRTSERASGRFFFLPRRPPTRHSPKKNKSSAAATTLPLRQLTVVDVVQQLAAPGDRHGGERERGAGACLALLLRLLLLNLSSRALAGCCSLALFTRGRARERGGRGEEACGREGCSRSVGLSLSARSGVCAVRAASRKGRDE